MKILMVASECVPLAKTGGLGDVVGALSGALPELGVECAVALPAYQSVTEKFPAEETGIEVTVDLDGGKATGKIFQAAVEGPATVYLIRNDKYFRRPEFYGTPQGDYPDNAERFAFFSKAALEFAAATGPWDVIHCHDWQSALIPVLNNLAARPARPKTVLTIHNLAHQGVFPYSEWPLLGLEASYFHPKYLEFYGRINFLKGGMLFSDAITTVSRKYAQEILTREYGAGLEGVLADRRRDLRGILNGVDYRDWSPESDPHIKKKYSAANPAGKAECKSDLERLYGLPQKSSAPLLGIVSRLADQ